MISPIGIFDSGLGGLSVAAELTKKMPNEQIIYFADNAHLPYGEKPLELIQEFALNITAFLIDKGAKAIVMACNMSSAVALDMARERFPKMPILGMIESGAKAAVEASKGEPIGILATTGTVKSNAYRRVIAGLDSSIKVVQQACPKFVPIVESGKADSEEAEAAACEYVAPLLQEGCKTIVLGCTHYPFLHKAIQAVAGDDVAIVDPAKETVRELHNILFENSLLSDYDCPEHIFYASGEIENFTALGSRFLGKPIENVESVRWGVDLGRKLRNVVV